jgi:hypothetical protein
MALRDDARQLLDIMASDPAFRAVGPDRIAGVARQLHVASDGPVDSFRLAAMRAMALGRNGHSRAIANGVARVAPLRLVWLQDGPCVTAGPLTGARVVSVNGRDADRLFAALGPWLAGTEQRARVLSGFMLAWPPALAAATGSGALDYDLVLPDRERRRLVLEPSADGTLYPVSETGVAATLVAAAGLDAGAGAAGVFATRLDGVAYVRLGDLASRPPAATAAALAAAAEAVEGAGAAVVDLRGNPGGDFFGAAAFATSLRGRLSGRRAVAALVDKFTFSAALVTAALLKVHAGARLVGEEMGDAASFWAEGGTTVLPASGLAIRHSDGWHDWQTGRPDPLTTPPEIAAHMVAAGPLLPDIAAAPTGADLAAGRDPALAAALDAVRA